MIQSELSDQLSISYLNKQIIPQCHAILKTLKEIKTANAEIQALNDIYVQAYTHICAGHMLLRESLVTDSYSASLLAEERYLKGQQSERKFINRIKALKTGKVNHYDQ